MISEQEVCYRAFITSDSRFDGRFFVAVHTTGIYCRPICPARKPKLKNVSFYASAEAAQEAGFRPCLRCRPEGSPHLAIWRGTGNTINRALGLIAEGGLDGNKVEDLATRLGLGERQIRRLFKQHLGVSPTAVARTRRVLFARQLIAETNMSLMQIALAAGFGSVRRFNHVFQNLYHRPPSAFRRHHLRKYENQKGDQQSIVTLMLPFAPPYHWPSMIEFLAARAIEGVEYIDEQKCYHRSISLGNHHGTISVGMDDRRSALHVTIRFPEIRALAEIVRRIRRMFDLSADPLAIDAHLSADPVLAPLVAARPGLRIPGTWDGFELAIRSVLEQQVTLKTTQKMLHQLAQSYGTPLAESGVEGITHLFPNPSQLIAIDLKILRMPSTCRECLKDIVRVSLGDPLFFGPAAMEKDIRNIPAIGEWTSQYIAMRALNDPNAFPAGDVALLKAMMELTGVKIKPAQLKNWTESWRPWRAYAAFHLWATLVDNKLGIVAISNAA